MNENDSEKLAGMLVAAGYEEASTNENCDVIVFNTCCVRENAEQKVYGHLGQLKKFKKLNPEAIIAVCGCMTQQPEVVEHIKKTYRHVDIIFGTHNLHKFPDFLREVLDKRERLFDITDENGVYENIPIKRENDTKAWVTIMYGCDNFCTYCIVPYVRGRERSRQMDDIVNEVKMLARNNIKEITLLGQNVNSYGKELDEKTNFAALIRKLNLIEGIERIRFMTSHPKDLSDEMIKAIAESEKVCRHIHLPVQAGSSRILKLMNRRYTKEKYIALIEKIRKAIPGIALTTDIIIGFPGETEEDFEETLDLIRKVRFDFAYTFLYSKRTGTPAAKLPEQIPAETMKKRFKRFAAVQNKISKELNEKLVGTVQKVLVEGVSKNNPEMLTGRTETNKTVNFKGDQGLKGKIIAVRIDKAMTWSLDGNIDQDK